jgi:hypothetical protein
MTLKELKERVDWAIENGDDDLKVCIPNNKVGMGGTSVTFVKQAARGIDWDSGKFILWPETEMIERTKDDIIDEEKLNNEAKRHAENYNKLFPPKHLNLSDDECDRIKDVALGSHYIGYKQGYKNAKNK